MVLTLVPRRPDAEERATSREDVEGRYLLDEQARMAIGHAGYERPEPQPAGVRRRVTQRRVRLQHVPFGRADGRNLEEVVHDGHVAEASLISGAGKLGEIRAEFG